MTLDTREISKRFGKAALLDISDELDIDVDRGTHTYKLVRDIRSNLEEDGVPEIDDMSDELRDISVAMGFIDNDGNLLEDDAEEVQEEKIEEPENPPACYGQGDMRDPPCKKCPENKACMQERKARRPACYGVLHDNAAPDCDICIYYQECTAAMPK